LNTLGDQLKDAQTNLDEARNQPAPAGSTGQNAKLRTATEKVEKTRQLLGKLQEVLAPSPQETAALGLTSQGNPAQLDGGKTGTTTTEQKPAEKDGPAPDGSSAPPRN
jgi:hypothetical protein